MAPVIIGNREFATKAQAEREFRNILHRYPLGHEVSHTEDVQLLLDLVHLHPEPKRKIGPGIEHFEVRSNPQYPRNRSFFIVYIDGTDDDFGYTKLISPASHPQLVAAAMRHEIKPQIDEFRDAQFSESPMILCPIDGSEISTSSQCHVDHHNPEFQLLVQRFVDLYSGWEAVKLASQPHQIGPRLADRELARQWAEYHRLHAQLRIVSIKANLSILRRGLPDHSQ